MALLRKICNNQNTCINFLISRTVSLASNLNFGITGEAQKSIPKVKTVTLIPGDGVWPELISTVPEVFQQANFPVEFEEFFVSGGYHDDVQRKQSAKIEDVIASVKRNKVCIKGNLSVPFGSSELDNVNMQMRRGLDLFANVVRVKTIEGVRTRHRPMDFVIIREQTEGEYSSLEHESVPGVVEMLKVITRKKSERIANFAFDYAVRHNRKKVTAIHKANIMKLGDGLFLESCQKVANLYPHMKFDSMIIDNCCMQLVSNPYQFDVMVMPNLYGSIVDNTGVGLVGGAGVVPGESFSHEVAVFEPGARHSFATAMGRDIANPTSILLTAANMLQHLNLWDESLRLKNAVYDVIKKGKVLTSDMGGSATTTDFTRAIVETLLKSN